MTSKNYSNKINGSLISLRKKRENLIKIITTLTIITTTEDLLLLLPMMCLTKSYLIWVRSTAELMNMRDNFRYMKIPHSPIVVEKKGKNSGNSCMLTTM